MSALLSNAWTDPLWYKDAVIYQLHIKAMFDSNGDGVGDFAGLMQRLDYVQELGVTATIVMPLDAPRAKRNAAASYGARIITYGLSEGATVRAANVTSAWPERLSLDVCHAGGRHHVQTQLLGTHWTHTVLAALSAALGTGVPLQRAVKAVEAFAPIPYRMSPHETPGGVTFVSDTRKAPFWTIGASLEFLRAARAERKILVIGAVSDTSKGFRQRYATIARQALEAADKAFDAFCAELRAPAGVGKRAAVVGGAPHHAAQLPAASLNACRTSSASPAAFSATCSASDSAAETTT